MNIKTQRLVAILVLAVPLLLRRDLSFTERLENFF